MKGVTKLAAGPGNVGLADRDAPEAGPGEVVLRVLAAGICGTDLHIEAGEYPSVPPVTMGHEACGLVVAAGPGADPAWVGRRAVVETYFSTCGRCAYCLAGRRNLCPERRSIGTHVDGAFAPLLRMPAIALHELPEGLPDTAAALVEPLACVCNALFDPPVVQAGDRALVTGPGAMGLIAAQVARSFGARVTVRGIERDAARLELARELGFETQVAGAEAQGGDYDVTLECSGAGQAVRSALEETRRGGRVVQIGLRGADVTVPFDQICFRELVVTSGFASTPSSWRRALRLVHDGTVELAPLVSRVGPLEEWESLFDDTRAGRVVKCVFVPGDAH